MRGAFVLGAAAAAVNGGIFLLLAWSHAPASRSAGRPALVVRELFFAPVPRPRGDERRTAEVVTAVLSAPTTASPPPEGAGATALEPAREPFEPRNGPAAWFEPSPTGVGTGLAVRVPIGGGGGSTEGVVGGGAIAGAGGGPGGVPGGTGSGVYPSQGVDRGPQRLVAPLPPYPQWGRTQRLEGVVTVRIVVAEDGAVRQASVERVDGDPRFGELARAAVEGWRFEPARAGGRGVACTVLQRVRFQLVE
ncbi:MAG: energy transducer TonB [Planctomycetes bacterium]|nr:energy transducer TonB [Planctomycetota bacterium]